MKEPPEHVTDADVLAVVRTQWLPAVEAVDHLPVGFGAHHWAACTGGTPRLFVTFDGLLPRHSEASLEAAYAGAAALAEAGLEFVIPCLPTAGGSYTVPLADGRLSATPWVDGPAAGDDSLTWQLARLHAAAPPPGLPRWSPLVSESYAATLAPRLAQPWSSGPYAEQVRESLGHRLVEIERWTASYHRLAADAHDLPWVATHGEPHSRNTLLTDRGPVLVDWESLKLAPPERDARPMTELFDLEWRLDEISQYAEWFRAPHSGTADDYEAFVGLRHELTRPDWRRG